ncbi:MAG: repressor LexA [Parasphingorhabdus sp.]
MHQSKFFTTINNSILILKISLYKIPATEINNRCIEMLTKRQQQILDFIKKSIELYDMPPTRAEIGEAFGFRSPNAAEDHLRALERKGVINIFAGSSRGIQLNVPTGIPVIGSVAAGNPILAEENIEDHYSIPRNMFRPKAHYFLRVKGQSMQDAGILDGDLLAVHRTRKAENGQIVVARLDDEVTVKQFRQRGNIVTLLPKNPDYEPIRVDLRKQNLEIEGLGVGLFRNGLPV